MENYNEMQQRITQYEADCNAQGIALANAVAAAEAELAAATAERDAAIAAANVNQVTQKNALVQIKEAALDGLRKQLSVYRDPRIPATTFNGWMAELSEYTQAQQRAQYIKLKKAIDDAEAALDALDQIRDQYNDTYALLDHLTYNGQETDHYVDGEGNRYNLGGIMHNKPDVFRNQIQRAGIGSVRQQTDLMAERFGITDSDLIPLDDGVNQ